MSKLVIMFGELFRHLAEVPSGSLGGELVYAKGSFNVLDGKVGTASIIFGNLSASVAMDSLGYVRFSVSAGSPTSPTVMSFFDFGVNMGANPAFNDLTKSTDPDASLEESIKDLVQRFGPEIVKGAASLAYEVALRAAVDRASKEE